MMIKLTLRAFAFGRASVWLLSAHRLLAQDAPIPAREAPLRMTAPEGFKVTLFAGEPDVVQPIAMCWDTRGRLWVAECLSYPKWHKDLTQGRITNEYLQEIDRRTCERCNGN